MATSNSSSPFLLIPSLSPPNHQSSQIKLKSYEVSHRLTPKCFKDRLWRILASQNVHNYADHHAMDTSAVWLPALKVSAADIIVGKLSVGLNPFHRRTIDSYCAALSSAMMTPDISKIRPFFGSLTTQGAFLELPESDTSCTAQFIKVIQSAIQKIASEIKVGVAPFCPRKAVVLIANSICEDMFTCIGGFARLTALRRSMVISTSTAVGGGRSAFPVGMLRQDILLYVLNGALISGLDCMVLSEGLNIVDGPAGLLSLKHFHLLPRHADTNNSGDTDDGSDEEDLLLGDPRYDIHQTVSDSHTWTAEMFEWYAQMSRRANEVIVSNARPDGFFDKLMQFFNFLSYVCGTGGPPTDSLAADMSHQSLIGVIRCRLLKSIVGEMIAYVSGSNKLRRRGFRCPCCTILSACLSCAMSNWSIWLINEVSHMANNRWSLTELSHNLAACQGMSAAGVMYITVLEELIASFLYLLLPLPPQRSAFLTLAAFQDLLPMIGGDTPTYIHSMGIKIENPVSPRLIYSDSLGVFQSLFTHIIPYESQVFFRLGPLLSLTKTWDILFESRNSLTDAMPAFPPGLAATWSPMFNPTLTSSWTFSEIGSNKLQLFYSLAGTESSYSVMREIQENAVAFRQELTVCPEQPKGDAQTTIAHSWTTWACSSRFAVLWAHLYQFLMELENSESFDAMTEKRKSVFPVVEGRLRLPEKTVCHSVCNSDAPFRSCNRSGRNAKSRIVMKDPSCSNLLWRTLTATRFAAFYFYFLSHHPVTFQEANRMSLISQHQYQFPKTRMCVPVSSPRGDKTQFIYRIALPFELGQGDSGNRHSKGTPDTALGNLIISGPDCAATNSSTNHMNSGVASEYGEELFPDVDFVVVSVPYCIARLLNESTTTIEHLRRCYGAFEIVAGIAAELVVRYIYSGLVHSTNFVPYCPLALAIKQSCEAESENLPALWPPNKESSKPYCSNDGVLRMPSMCMSHFTGLAECLGLLKRTVGAIWTLANDSMLSETTGCSGLGEFSKPIIQVLLFSSRELVPVKSFAAIRILVFCFVHGCSISKTFLPSFTPFQTLVRPIFDQVVDKPPGNRPSDVITNFFLKDTGGDSSDLPTVDSNVPQHSAKQNWETAKRHDLTITIQDSENLLSSCNATETEFGKLMSSTVRPVDSILTASGGNINGTRSMITQVLNESSPGGKLRILTWLQEKRVESQRFILHLMTTKAAHAQNGGPVEIEVLKDWEVLTPEEQQIEIRNFSSAGLNSPFVRDSLQFLPLKLNVVSLSCLPFIRQSFQSFFTNIRSRVSTHMNAEISRYVDYLRTSPSCIPSVVVISMQDILPWGLKEVCIHLPPVFDLYFPFALDWDKLRARFIAELWSQARDMLNKYWYLRHAELAGGHPPCSIPELVFAFEVESRSVVDLTPLRLETLMHMVINRIGEAFHAFWITSLSSLKSGGFASLTTEKIVEIATLVNTTGVFRTDETFLDERKTSAVQAFASQLPRETIAEDMLLSADVAALLFLSVYAGGLSSVVEQLSKKLRQLEGGTAAQYTMNENGQWTLDASPASCPLAGEGEIKSEVGSAEILGDSGRGGSKRRRTRAAGLVDAGDELNDTSLYRRLQESGHGSSASASGLGETETDALRRGRRMNWAIETDKKGGISAALAAVECFRKEVRQAGVYGTRGAGSRNAAADDDSSSNVGGSRHHHHHHRHHPSSTTHHQLDGGSDELKQHSSIYGNRTSSHNNKRTQSLSSTDNWLNDLPSSLKMRLNEVLPSTEISATVTTTSEILNGFFPVLDDSVANMPLILRWQNPKQSSTNGGVQFKSSSAVADKSTADSISGRGPNEDLSEYDWRVICEVLHCLYHRGIDYLVSLQDGVVFRLCSAISMMVENADPALNRHDDHASINPHADGMDDVDMLNNNINTETSMLDSSTSPISSSPPLIHPGAAGTDGFVKYIDHPSLFTLSRTLHEKGPPPPPLTAEDESSSALFVKFDDPNLMTEDITDVSEEHPAAAARKKRYRIADERSLRNYLSSIRRDNYTATTSLSLNKQDVSSSHEDDMNVVLLNAWNVNNPIIAARTSSTAEMKAPISIPIGGGFLNSVIDNVEL